MIPRSLAASLVACLLPVSVAIAGPDPLYRAGQMLGRWLYWLPQTGLPLDTLGMRAVERAALYRDDGSAATLPQALASLNKYDKTIYRLDKTTALALSLLMDKQHTVFALTQWHCSLSDKVLVPKPGMEQKAMKHSMVSDFAWEILERTEVLSPPGITTEYRVKLFFHDAGFCEYEGSSIVTGDDRQILGSQGMTVEVKEAQYKQDMNVRRKVFAVYVVVPSSMQPADLQKEIESSMDKLKLDLSYKAPEVRVVKTGR